MPRAAICRPRRFPCFMNLSSHFSTAARLLPKAVVHFFRRLENPATRSLLVETFSFARATLNYRFIVALQFVSLRDNYSLWIWRRNFPQFFANEISRCWIFVSSVFDTRRRNIKDKYRRKVLARMLSKYWKKLRARCGTISQINVAELQRQKMKSVYRGWTLSRIPAPNLSCALVLPHTALRSLPRSVTFRSRKIYGKLF